MIVALSEKGDFNAWLNLAKEVEHLFGPMAEEESFKNVLAISINKGCAFCIKREESGENSSLFGGVVIVPDENEIGWLAVSAGCRRQGAGEMLLTYAIKHLDNSCPLKVVTFADTVSEGLPVRNLYLKHGFRDRKSMGKNPAGIPIVQMVRPGQL